MSKPAAKQDDQVTAMDVHLILPPSSSLPVPVPHPFTGVIDSALSADVFIQGKAAATLGSSATNTPAHVQIGGSFVIQPRNQAKIVMGSLSVLINSKPAARAGDTALTCNDPVDLPVGKVVAVSTVFIGD